MGSTEAVKSAVKAGLGASILLEEAVADDVAGGRLASVALEGVSLAKTFYTARPASLPDDDVTARFARSLSSTAVKERGLRSRERVEKGV